MHWYQSCYRSRYLARAILLISASLFCRRYKLSMRDPVSFLATINGLFENDEHNPKLGIFQLRHPVAYKFIYKKSVLLDHRVRVYTRVAFVLSIRNFQRYFGRSEALNASSVYSFCKKRYPQKHRRESFRSPHFSHQKIYVCSSSRVQMSFISRREILCSVIPRWTGQRVNVVGFSSIRAYRCRRRRQ